jgi:hypothetical protein
VNHIATSLEKKKYCSELFFDVAQAFDTVRYDGLLYKLKKIFPAPNYLLLKLYLNNRTFRVKLKTTFTNSQNILASVPQRSDIAPFLYTLFTADIPITDNTLIGIYTNDTAILSSSQDPHEASGLLQNHLNSSSHRFKSWKIKINDSKSSHVISLRFGNCPHITFENAIIPHTNEGKYLGLLFDRRLTWGTHLKTKRKQLNSRLHILRPLMKSNMYISNRLLLYKSLLQSIWSYLIAL